MRIRTILAWSLVALTLASGPAWAQISDTSSSGSSSSSSSSLSLGDSDVFAALALGAGRRGAAGIDRAEVRSLLDDDFLAADPCVIGVRVRGVNAVQQPVRLTEDMQQRLARGILESDGNLSTIAQAFAGRRDRLAPASCDATGAVHVSHVLFDICSERGRGCALALVLRLVLDANGLDASEKKAAVRAMT